MYLALCLTLNEGLLKVYKKQGVEWKSPSFFFLLEEKIYYFSETCGQNSQKLEC